MDAAFSCIVKSVKPPRNSKGSKSQCNYNPTASVGNAVAKPWGHRTVRENELRRCETIEKNPSDNLPVRIPTKPYNVITSLPLDE